jgi:hypothetical protein
VIWGAVFFLIGYIFATLQALIIMWTTHKQILAHLERH